MGMRFVSQLAKEFEGVCKWKHKSELSLIFPVVILCQNPQVIKACDIWQWIERHMDLWDEGHISALSNCVDEVLWNSGSGKVKGIEA